MSTSFALWPSDRFEVSVMVEKGLLLRFLEQIFSLLDLLIVKCKR